jgi:glycogen synthase
MRGKGARFDPVGGMQNHTGELTRALDRQGIVQIVVTTRPPTAPNAEDFGRHARVIRLGMPIRYFRQFYSFPAAILVPRLAATVDLIHVHQGEDLAVLPIGVLAARLRRLPLVVTIHCSLRHTLSVTDPRAWVLKTIGGRIETWAAHQADAVIALTPRLAGLLQAGGLDARGIHIIPSGVNPALFKGPLVDPFAHLPRPRIAFVGRLAAQKSVHTLVKAVSRLRTLGVQVLLVGDGLQRPKLEALVHELGLEDRVHFIGFVPHEEVPAVLNHVDALVLPSVSEELGSVLLEATQSGLPIVASRTGGIPDVIRDGENGLLFTPGNAGELAGAVDRVLKEPELASRLGTEARRRAKYYDWNRLAEQVLEIYWSVMSRHRQQKTLK